MAFFLVNIIGALLFWGGKAGLLQLIYSINESVASFTFIPLMLFILMGSLLFHSGIALNTIDALDKWMGRVPGRLGLVAVASGVLIGTLSGSSMASGAILGSALTPEMERRGYKKTMSLGPILGSGGLALLIPPSAVSVLVAALAETSVADVLIGGVIPGIIMAMLYAGYIIIKCWLDPSVAPPYEVTRVPFSEKAFHFMKYVLPLGLVIFLVTGVIFFGIATPSEAAATGALGSLILAVCYGRLSWPAIQKTFIETLKITIMMFIIISSAVAFGQILAFSGATAGLTHFLTGLPVHPIMVVIILQIILVVLGMFAGHVPIIMVVVPLFIPIIKSFGMSPVWFCLLLILNIEMGATSPPFGFNIFVIKAVAPKDTTMGDIYRAALPYLYCDAVVMALMLAFPAIVLWLPGMMS
ncbi:MAG: TRAP transporter large permease subunit [Deltaproteobacteria bacterium]|nr:TRAP transporter large permease subunit [Deltaproteobacteria bacterium]